MTIDKPSRFQLSDLRALWREAFGDSEEFLDIFERTAFYPDRCRCVTVGNRVATALYWFDCSYREERVAYLYAIATAKAYRGRGLCSVLMEDTHRHLRTLGYVGALLVPSGEDLFGFYRKLGYQVCSRVGKICCDASPNGLAVRQIDGGEYAMLRRSFLPADGVLQEEENLRFLQAQARLYTGEGFLLAARREKGSLFGLELLGDVAKAPAIVGTLGCTEGCFRIPEGEIPFAMYRPLQDRTDVPPAYFGLAFD